jgi:hypothetical protein
MLVMGKILALATNGRFERKRDFSMVTSADGAVSMGELHEAPWIRQASRNEAA